MIEVVYASEGDMEFDRAATGEATATVFAKANLDLARETWGPYAQENL